LHGHEVSVLAAPSSYQALVVEDNEHLSGLMEIALRQLGIQVTAVATGHGALDYLTERMPDIIILDLGLPEMSGWDVLDTMKARGREVTVPVIVLTAFVDPANRLIGRLNKPTVFRYLSKPFQIAALHTAVREALKLPT
jgi:CheY-like chemotaxis protein